MNVTSHSHGCPRRALALIVVVYVLAALSTLAFALAFRSRIGLWQADLAMDGVQQEEIALAVCAQAARLLALDDPNVDSYEDAWAQWHVLDVSQGPGDANAIPWDVRWRLQDEAAKLNVNVVPADVLLAVEGLDETVVGSIRDWIDEDDVPNPGGAETEYYASLPSPYACKNGPLETLEELARIKGVTPELYFGSWQEGWDDFEDPSQPYPGAADSGVADESVGLMDLLTVYGDGGINLNTASAPVLRAIPFLSDGAIEDILARQQPSSSKFAALEDIQASETFSDMDKIVLQQVARFNSNHFQLQVRLRPRGASAVYGYTAILQREEGTVLVVKWQRTLPRLSTETLAIVAAQNL